MWMQVAYTYFKRLLRFGIVTGSSSGVSTVGTVGPLVNFCSVPIGP